MKRSFAGALLIVCFGIIGSYQQVIAQNKHRLSFDQIFKNGEPRVIKPLPNIVGWADDSHYLEMKKREGDDRLKVYRVDAATGTETLFRDLGQFRPDALDGIDPTRPVTQNDAFTRLIYVKENDLYVLDTERKEWKRLTSTGVEKRNPTISPDGKYVAFTQQNNLYSIDLGTGGLTQYTTDGSTVVYSGWASWLYYEEILGRPSRYRAFWWAPDSKRIAFLRFDDSPVPVYPLFSSKGVHGYLENTRYPQAGDPNPYVKVGIVGVQGGPVVWAAFEQQADQYFGKPFWTPDGEHLFVQWMNRAQDTICLYTVDPSLGSKKMIYTEHQTSWVEWFESIYFLTNNEGFVLKTDKDGWAHLYRYDMSGRQVNRITEGKWSIENLLAINENSGDVYYTARKESSARIDLYRSPLKGGTPVRLTSGPFNNRIELSPQESYFITSYSNADTPTRMALCNRTGSIVRELGGSKTTEYDTFRMARTEFFAIKTPDGYNLPVVWTLPLDFDRTVKYPVIISVYGGPNSMTAWDSWGGLTRQWLAMEGAIQMTVDHRGSGQFGKEGVALMYRNLGKWELKDYIEAVKWLHEQPFVDSTRICITGASYGGYVTCMALTAGADYFPYGISLYPVTDWSLYDSHYVERYMGSPLENPEGYKNGSAITYANKYKGMLEIVEGTMDDNVHLQNTLQLVDTLESLNKHFEFVVYPGERHGAGGLKAAHQRSETYRFYYKYLLRKEFPEELFRNIGVMEGVRGRRP